MQSTSLSFAGLVIFSMLPAFAGSTSGPEKVKLGNYETSTWYSDDYKGSAYREWTDNGDFFRFKWQTDAGDQIGRIGVSYGSSFLGPKLSQLPADLEMSVKANYTPTTDHWFYWSIYGWTHSSYTYWGNTPHGWNNEFYIIFYTDKFKEAFLNDKVEHPIGSVTVDGQTFDCYNTLRANQSQWLAVCRTKTWSGSINLKKIFDYWRSQGLADEYVTDLGWALEGFQGSAGDLKLTDIKIPNLNLTATSPAQPPPPASH